MGQGAHDQAGCRLHRRFHRPRRQADGPRRRHRLRRQGTAQDKKNALEAAGIPVGKTPGQAAEIMRDVLAKANID